MQLSERISIVGSGHTGIEISHPLDPNVYLLSGGDELALIDAGADPGEDMIIENTRHMGYDPHRIKHIFLTHAHADHAGGAASLATRLGASVYLSEIERRALEEADEAALGLDVARRNNFYPRDYKMDPCKVDVALRGEECLRCGDLELQIIATPGHSAGSVCYLLQTASDRILFAGDTVFAGGEISLIVAPGSDLLSLHKSIEALAKLEITALLPGHGAFPLNRGQEHVSLAARTFETMRLPKSVLE